MSAATMPRRAPSLFDREEPPPAADGRRDDGSTLEDLVLGVWEDLSARRPVGCPICRGSMVARYGAGPAPVGGRCLDCGGELA